MDIKNLDVTLRKEGHLFIFEAVSSDTESLQRSTEFYQKLIALAEEDDHGNQL